MKINSKFFCAIITAFALSLLFGGCAGHQQCLTPHEDADLLVFIDGEDFVQVEFVKVHNDTIYARETTIGNVAYAIDDLESVVTFNKKRYTNSLILGGAIGAFSFLRLSIGYDWVRDIYEEDESVSYFPVMALPIVFGLFWGVMADWFGLNNRTCCKIWRAEDLQDEQIRARFLIELQRIRFEE